MKLAFTVEKFDSVVVPRTFWEVITLKKPIVYHRVLVSDTRTGCGHYCCAGTGPELIRAIVEACNILQLELDNRKLSTKPTSTKSKT